MRKNRTFLCLCMNHHIIWSFVNNVIMTSICSAFRRSLIISARGTKLSYSVGRRLKASKRVESGIKTWKYSRPREFTSNMMLLPILLILLSVSTIFHMREVICFDDSWLIVWRLDYDANISYPNSKYWASLATLSSGSGPAFCRRSMQN
jgi:hypothetical protein